MVDHSASSSSNDVLVPLIDVLLVVLCFVLWAGVSQVKVPVKAAAPQAAAASDQPVQRLAMEPRGFWRWNGEPISDAQLRGRLQQQSLQEQTSPILLLPSDALTLLEVSERFNSLEVLVGERLQLQLPGEAIKP